MFGLIETVSATILLVLLMIWFLHVLRGDATAWLKAKFLISDGMLSLGGEKNKGELGHP